MSLEENAFTLHLTASLLHGGMGAHPVCCILEPHSCILALLLGCCEGFADGILETPRLAALTTRLQPKSLSQSSQYWTSYVEVCQAPAC